MSVYTLNLFRAFNQILLYKKKKKKNGLSHSEVWSKNLEICPWVLLGNHGVHVYCQCTGMSKKMYFIGTWCTPQFYVRRGGWRKRGQAISNLLKCYWKQGKSKVKRASGSSVLPRNLGKFVLYHCTKCLGILSLSFIVFFFFLLFSFSYLFCHKLPISI